MNEFSELDMINRMYEENIDNDRHFDEILINKGRHKMIVEDISTGWEIFNQMPNSLKMEKIIGIVGDDVWRQFLDDDIPENASSFSILDRAIKKFESEISEYFAIGNL